MKTCKKCNKFFSAYPIIDGKRRNFRKRVHCSDCNRTPGPPRMTYEERQRGKLNSHLRHYYKIDLEEFERLQAEQDNKCAICGGDPPTSRKRRLSVDHCHATEQVRGLLCTRCNTMLGWLEDNKQAVEEYLS